MPVTGEEGTGKPIWPRVAALGGALALVVAGLLWLWHTNRAGLAKSLPGGTQAANSPSNSAAVTPAAERARGELSPVEMEKLRRRFEERLAVFTQLRAEATRKREELSRRKPNPFEVADYGRKKSIELEERYQQFVAENPAYFQGQDSSFEKLLKLNYEFKLPAYLLQSANSKEEVEGTTLGAVVHALLDQSNYHEFLADQLLEGFKGRPDLAARVEGLKDAKDAETALAILREAEPFLSKEYQGSASPISKGDQAFETYMGDTFRSLVLQGVLTAQKEALMGEINAIEQKEEAAGHELTAMLERLPRFSDTQTHLATLFKEALK